MTPLQILEFEEDFQKLVSLQQPNKAPTETSHQNRSSKHDQISAIPAKNFAQGN